MRTILLALAAVGTLASCSNNNAQIPAQTVATLELGLTAAENTALGYVRLPRCPQGAPVCSDPAIVQKIRDADAGAYAEVKKLESVLAANPNATISASAATVALQVLTDAVNTPIVQKALKGGQ